MTLWPLSVEQVTSALATLVKRHAWFPGLRDTPHPALLSYRQYNAYSLLVEFLFVLDTRFDGATNAISLLPAEVFLEFIPFLATPFSVEAASHSSDVIPHTKPVCTSPCARLHRCGSLADLLVATGRCPAALMLGRVADCRHRYAPCRRCACTLLFTSAARRARGLVARGTILSNTCCLTRRIRWLTGFDRDCNEH